MGTPHTIELDRTLTPQVIEKAQLNLDAQFTADFQQLLRVPKTAEYEPCNYNVAQLREIWDETTIPISRLMITAEPSPGCDAELDLIIGSLPIGTVVSYRNDAYCIIRHCLNKLTDPFGGVIECKEGVALLLVGADRQTAGPKQEVFAEYQELFNETILGANPYDFGNGFHPTPEEYFRQIAPKEE